MKKAASELSSSSFSKRGLLHNLSYKKTFHSRETKLFQVKSCVQSLFEIRLKITKNYSLWSSTVVGGGGPYGLNFAFPPPLLPPPIHLPAPFPRAPVPPTRFTLLLVQIVLFMFALDSFTLFYHSFNDFYLCHDLYGFT